MRNRSIWAMLLALALVVAACGGSDDTADTSTTVADTQATTTTPGTEGETTTTGSATDAMDNLRTSTIRIVANGTFVDPQEGEQANVAGSGSGFIIDESGIAVTNNHVVTGAAFLDVFIDGRSEPINARILGVSECSDLAVIDLEGDGYSFLTWFEGEIRAGLGILAAGFPRGTEQYTLLEGIVSKEDFVGETSWASVDAVIEHSADTLPGNSGGPIVTSDGEIVAVNFAGNDDAQSFAIGREIARPAIQVLAGGENLDTIGINGEAFVTETFSGIWVYSVASGSPADRVGIEPGDIVTRLEGLVLATDGTMGDYCDILRSHGPDDVLAVEVYRPTVDALFEGRLNDDSAPLVEIFSFATEVDEATDDPPDAGGETYASYVEVSDDSGSIVTSIPAEWSDVLGVPWEFNGELIGPALGAAPDYDAWQSGWATPGVFIAASRTVGAGIAEMLDFNDFSSDCVYGERLDYDDGLYVGLMDLWDNCGAEGSAFVVIAAEPPAQDFLILVQIVIVSDADWDAADEIVRTFQITDPQAP